MTPDLLIRDALIVTADAAGTVLGCGTLAVAGGRIAALGPASAMPRDAPQVVDGRGLLLMPGLVNMHCHAADSLFRGLVEDLALEPWLQTVWKAEAAILTPQTVRLGATLGLGELLLAGVTTVMDMFWHPRETVAAAQALGMRIAAGAVVFDGPGVDGSDAAGRLRDAKAFLSEFAGAPDVLPAVMPHGAYTVAPEGLEAARRIAASHGALFSIHAAETRAEQADNTKRYGRSVIRHLDHLGLLDERAVLAHCVWLDDAEIEILARTKAHVAHNPVSNLKLASGIARVPDLLAAGVPVSLGTDGAISGNDLDPWLAMRLAAMLHKGATLRPDAVSTAQALAMATREGARALGATDRLGSLEPGKEADLVLIDLDVPNAVPLFDPLTHLVYSCGRADVRHVFVGGRPVVRNGALVRVDMAETLAEVSALAPRIAASVGG